MFTKQKRDELAEEYHKGNTDRVIEEVWKETDKQLRKGVMDGYGKTGYDVDDFDTVFQLNSNIGVFSAFKSYRVNQEMKANLTDENGKKLPFDKFLKEYQKIDAEYNINYLRAEYNLSQRQASSANQWNDFQRSKDLYPNLKYMPSRSAEPRQDHTKYYGIIKPIDDPIWNDLMPPIAWGCNCWVTNTDEPSVATTVEPPEPVNGIIGNAGKNGAVFSNSHAYSKNVDKASKQKIATFLSKMKNKHLSEEYVSGKVGKGRVKVSLNTHPDDFSNNIQFAYATTSNHGRTFELPPHSYKDGVKSPELYYLKTKGDGTLFEGDNGVKYVKNSFQKYKPKQQLADLKSSFIGLDFNGRITTKNIEPIVRKLWGEFKIHDRCTFMVLKNKSKTVIIDKADNYNSILEKVKGELL